MSPSEPLSVTLRPVIETDLGIFFEQGRDPLAVRMAAFTSKDPGDRTAFDAHWARIRQDPAIQMRTVLVEGEIAGSVLCYPNAGKTEVTYWIGRSYWGRGIATAALRQFLELLGSGPIAARVARDNAGSIRVLEKCGFRVVGEDRGFANARASVIDELFMLRDGPGT